MLPPIKRPSYFEDTQPRAKVRSELPDGVERAAAPQNERQPSGKAPQSIVLPSIAQLIEGMPEACRYPLPIAILKTPVRAVSANLPAVASTRFVYPPQVPAELGSTLQISQTCPEPTTASASTDDPTNNTVSIPGARVSTGLTIPHSLLQSLLELGFNQTQMQQISKRYGARAAFQTLLEATPILRERGVSIAEIVRIASNNGAAHALAALLEDGPKLLQAGFSHRDIVKIAAHNGAAQAMPTLLEGGPRLSELGFSQEQIVRIANKDGAAQSLQALIDAGSKLLQAAFSHADLVKIASNNGGGRAIPALLVAHPKLANLGFSQQDIVDIASKEGAAQALSTLPEQHAILRRAHFSQYMICTIAISRSATKKLALLTTHHAALQARGLSSGLMTIQAKATVAYLEAWINEQL